MIVDFDGKWRPGWLYVEAKIFYIYIIGLIGPFKKIWEYAMEISGNSQGKIVPHLKLWTNLLLK